MNPEKSPVESGQEIKSTFHIRLITITPFLTPEMARSAAKSADVIILETYPSGATPSDLRDFVEENVRAGTPVFLVSTNIGDEHGILNPNRYETTSKVLQAGAVPIEKINAKDVGALQSFIQKCLAEGIRGAALSEKVKNEFSFKEGEAKPVPEWDTPEGIESLRQSTKWALARSGLKGEQLEEAMRKWEFGDQGDAKQNGQ